MDNDMILGNDIYLMGKSFGAAVAIYTASQLSSREGLPVKDIFKGLILESGFTSVDAAI
jgi:surfactin synthase thioesterase subunit